MKILIIGASSYVGAKLYKDLQKDFHVIGTYHSNKLFHELIRLDVTKKSDVLLCIQEIKPDYIVHIAANANIASCDQDVNNTIALNQEATQFLVEAANLNHSTIVFISSFLANNPASLYGKTKLESERLIKEATNGYLILRLSLILGYSPNTMNDRPFNRLLRNIEANQPVSYDTSWHFQPTWLKHISEILKELVIRGVKNETIPIAVPKVITRYDYAKDILSDYGIEVTQDDG